MKPYRIDTLAQKYVGYDMISTHTVLPEFPVPRVTLLYTFLNSYISDQKGNKDNTTAETCSLAAFLVQLGLDTHDTIDLETSQQDELSMRSRQMKVLAGDYFSGVFYQLLSQAGEIEMVSAMSKAICEVNRLKVRLYSKLKDNESKGLLLFGEDYLKELVSLKTELFYSFSHLLDKSVHNIWELLLAEVGRCEVIYNELSSIQKFPSTYKGYAYYKMMETGTVEDKQLLSAEGISAPDWLRLIAKYNVEGQLLSLLHESVEAAQLLIQECQDEQTRSELVKVLQSFIAILTPAYRSLQER